MTNLFFDKLMVESTNKSIACKKYWSIASDRKVDDQDEFYVDPSDITVAEKIPGLKRGFVVSTKMQKTIAVKVDRRVYNNWFQLYFQYKYPLQI